MKIKKSLISLLTLSAVLSMNSMNISAVSEYNISDMIHLHDALLCKTDVTAKDDVNSDGFVNVFDLCQLKKILCGDSGAVTESSYSATAENVKLTGRTVRSEDTTWLVQSGSSAEFTISAQSAEIVLAGDNGIYSDADYRPRYAVYVNDELIIDKTMDNAKETVTLFEGTSSQTATVKVIMLSEAMYGAIGVKNINVASSANTPVRPTAKKDISIEFIGDSITCAYGVEGASNYESFKTTTENFTKSYAYLTAQKLNADYSAVCYSGHGIISGYTSSGDKNTDSLIPDCYEVASKQAGYAVDWDFTSTEHDVVVINLGTNDSGYVSADMENRSSEFVEGYIDFLNTIREKNPQAYIICTLGTMGCEDVYTLVEQAVDEYKVKSGDERIMSYQSTVQNQADGYGSDWHPSAVTQQNSAYVLADKICQVLGMESDQIGLDVAVDATYDVKIDSESGANAASYVGYDKSFWINMVAGGDSSDDIEAVISGIGLKKNGEYRLEFDYTSTVDATIPIAVRSTSGEYHTDSIKAVSEKLHYSETFTVSSDDENAEIAFSLGGMDYYNVTLSNVKLVKIG